MRGPTTIMRALTITLLAGLAVGAVVLFAPRDGIDPTAPSIVGEKAAPPTGGGLGPSTIEADQSPTPPAVVSGPIDPSRLPPWEARSGQFDLKCVVPEPDPDKCPGWIPVSDARP